MAAALAARPMLGTAAFEVRRDDLRSTRLVAGHIDTASEVAAGRAVVAVDRFALTANNITYAAFGDQMAYRRFFPASDGYGRIPVWGFADVMASGAEGLAEGERLFGYWPMATHCVVEPASTLFAKVEDRRPNAAEWRSRETLEGRVPPSQGLVLSLAG